MTACQNCGNPDSVADEAVPTYESGSPPEAISVPAGARIATAADAWAQLRARYAPRGAWPVVEEFVAICLDASHRVLEIRMLSRGSATGVDVHPRDVFRELLRNTNSIAVIFAHNHPSGDPTPSQQDVVLSSRLREAGNMLGMPVLDQLVVSANGYAAIPNL